MKTTKNNIDDKTLAKERNDEWEEYFNWNSWRLIPYNNETCINWAKKLLKWAKLEKSLRINDFYHKEGISSDTFYNMMERSKELKKAHSITKEMLASRREIGAALGKYKEATIFRTLPHYCDIDKEQVEMRAALVAKYKANLEEHETKIVVIEKMPESKTVKAKKS